MSKLSDTIKAALDKKKGVRHLENDAVGTAEIKLTKVKTKPPTGKKPATRNTGRGR
jgi:hypothetical protein